MKSTLIGIVLKTLQDEYNSGACDNLTEEEKEDLLGSLVTFHDMLTNKSDKMLTIEEASQYLHCSRQSIYNYVRQGKLTPKKHLGGVMEFKLSDIKRFVYENKVV